MNILQILENGFENTLIINNMRDIYNNINPKDTIQFIYYEAAFNDVIISEIMADPNPPILLPDVEYLELYNRSGYPINMDCWNICIRKSCVEIQDFTIKPEEYILVCDVVDYSSVIQFNNVLSLAGLPQLTNTGQELTLKNEENSTMDSK